MEKIISKLAEHPLITLFSGTVFLVTITFGFFYNALYTPAIEAKNFEIKKQSDLIERERARISLSIDNKSIGSKTNIVIRPSKITENDYIYFQKYNIALQNLSLKEGWSTKEITDKEVLHDLFAESGMTDDIIEMIAELSDVKEETLIKLNNDSKRLSMEYEDVYRLKHDVMGFTLTIRPRIDILFFSNEMIQKSETYIDSDPLNRAAEEKTKENQLRIRTLIESMKNNTTNIIYLKFEQMSFAENLAFIAHDNLDRQNDFISKYDPAHLAGILSIVAKYEIGRVYTFLYFIEEHFDTSYAKEVAYHFSNDFSCESLKDNLQTSNFCGEDRFIIPEKDSISWKEPDESDFPEKKKNLFKSFYSFNSQFLLAGKPSSVVEDLYYSDNLFLTKGYINGNGFGEGWQSDIKEWHVFTMGLLNDRGIYMFKYNIPVASKKDYEHVRFALSAIDSIRIVH